MLSVHAALPGHRPDRRGRTGRRTACRRMLGRPVVRTHTEPRRVITLVALRPVSSSLPEVPRPDGPEADLSQRLTGGQGVFMGSSAKQESIPATSRRSTPPRGARPPTERGPLAADGVWTFRPTDKARYRTRVVVRRPAAGHATASSSWSGSTSAAGWMPTRRTRRSARRSSGRATRGWGCPPRRSASRAGRWRWRSTSPAPRTRGQGPQGHRPRALRVAAAPRRRVLLRHLTQVARACVPADRAAGGSSRARSRRWASRSPPSRWSPTSTACSR